MIDLSHLTEEEHGVIMTVMRRDAKLKKCEEERIRKLEKLLNTDSESDSKLKYLTGEWFYEAKSLRHMDTIHGSEIILASMKQRKPGLDGSLRIERSKSPSTAGSDIVPPPKPARCWDSLQPEEINDAEKENLNSAVRSPRTPRHNPFNRASLIVVEPPEHAEDQSTIRDQEASATGSEPVSPMKNQPPGDTSQTSGSDSVGFRPVPKKRTFVSRRSSAQTESDSQASDSQGRSAGIVPAPRRSLQQGSSGSSIHSCLKAQDESPATVSGQVSQSAQPYSSADETLQQPLHDAPQVLSKSTAGNPPPVTINRAATNIDSSTDGKDNQTQKQPAAVDMATAHSNRFQDSEKISSLGTATQGIVVADPPESYDLNIIDKSDQQIQPKSNHKNIFKLSTQTSSPTGEEEDSIAKVLDWFSRSTDSSDLLNDDDNPDRQGSLMKDTEDIISDRTRETLEVKRSHLQRQTNEAKELRAADRPGNKDTAQTQAEAKKDTRERIRPQELKDNDNEGQPAKISHLKSFWEKSNPGPKILISKSNTPSDKAQKLIQPSVEKDEEIASKPQRVSDVQPALGVNNEVGMHKYASNNDNLIEQQLRSSPQKVTKDTYGIHLNNNQQVDAAIAPGHWSKQQMSVAQGSDKSYSSDSLKLAASPQVVLGSNSEILCITGLQSETSVQSRTSTESDSISVSKSNLQPDVIFQSKETTPQDELSKMMPGSQLSVDSTESEKPYLSRNRDHKQGGSEPMSPKIQVQRGEDIKRRNSEDRGVHTCMSPKRKEDRQAIAHQDSLTERMKQLKSFWEQEKNKPVFYTGKPKGDGKLTPGASQAKLHKRFTKSEFDLQTMGKDSESDDEITGRNHQHFTVLPLNQRIEKMSPSLGRAQFNTLREFWGEAASDSKASFDKNKSPKRKEPVCLQPQELKNSDPDFCRMSSPVEKTSGKVAVMKSSPPVRNRSKSPHERQTGPRAGADSKTNFSNNNNNNYITGESGQQRESRKSSKDSGREEKLTKSQSNQGKEIRSPKSKKDSFSNSSSRVHSFRRATSMFSLNIPDEKDQIQRQIDVSPVRSQSRKQRQNSEKGLPRRTADETETLTPRARAFVPRDYRHYLGMTDKMSVHTSLAPTVQDQGSEGKSGYEYDLSGPVRASTPVSSEDSYTRKGNKTCQRPMWANYSSSDTGQESSVSSTSEIWSNTRHSSTREIDDNQSPVRRALRRAEARPKNLAKSMEDITATSAPRQERRPDLTTDLRCTSDESSILSPCPPLYLDPDHLKKMSKSVPSFLEKEDADDSTCEDSYHKGRLIMGSSMTNLTGSSGMASASSLSGSVMTMYSADLEVQGNIHFSIHYVQKLREFHIFVAQCQDLAAVDPKRGRSDPYVKTYLVPDKANLGKRKTSVKKKTLNPIFNEILRYRVRMEYLRTQTLILSVWHHDTFGRNSFLGEVDVDLSKWDFDHTQMNYLALKARTTPALVPSNGQGEMRLAIRFLPQISHSDGLAKDNANSGEIHIWVKECKNLPLIRATIDPYVKCFVLPDTSRKSRQKTRVLRRTVDPVFNHTMVYDGMREADLTEACVELTVLDRDRLGSNLLGGLRLGTGTGRSYGAMVDWMDSTPYEVALWERMIASPNEWVEDVLPLRKLNSKAALK